MTQALFTPPELTLQERKERFLRELKGNTQPYKRYLGSPIRYAGGKSLAVGLIIEHLPTDITRVISPFIGGGSTEIAIAKELNLPVKAYDIFDILVNFWQVAINHPNELHLELSKLPVTKEQYAQIKQELTDHFKQRIKLDPLTLARDYIYNFGLSYGPAFLGWLSQVFLDTHKYTQFINKIRDFGIHPNTKNLSVECADFQQVIQEHPNDFLLLDPPYVLENSKMFKGVYPSRNITIHHNGFKHETLRQLLHAHKERFILCYNDCAWVREAYAGYKVLEPKWQYTMGQGETRIGKNRIERGTPANIKESHELLIIKE